MLVSSLTTLSASANFERRRGAGLGASAGPRRARSRCSSCSVSACHTWTTRLVCTACRSPFTPATRATEILAAFGVGDGAKPPTWQTGVWWEPKSRTDLFAFTLDKSVRRLLADDPVPRLRDQPRADPLGEPVRDRRRQRDWAAVHPSARGRHERRAVRAAAHDRPRVLVSRPGVVREPRGRSSDRLRLEAPAAHARGALHLVRGCGRIATRTGELEARESAALDSSSVRLRRTPSPTSRAHARRRGRPDSSLASRLTSNTSLQIVAEGLSLIIVEQDIAQALRAEGRVSACRKAAWPSMDRRVSSRVR